VSRARLFVALTLPPELGAPLVLAIERDLGPGSRVRVTRPDALHLTLRFLGEVELSLAGALDACLAERVTGLPAPRLELGQPGAFPARRRERVLWIAPRELAGSEGRLAALERAVGEAVLAAGIPPGDERGRPWHPHLTVGRPHGRVAEAFYEGAHAVRWDPREVALVRSFLERPRARHEALGRYPLSPG
jgi:2'-5' RNA ligase